MCAVVAWSCLLAPAVRIVNGVQTSWLKVKNRDYSQMKGREVFDRRQSRAPVHRPPVLWPELARPLLLFLIIEFALDRIPAVYHLSERALEHRLVVGLFERSP
jgi:hypothetical protein